MTISTDLKSKIIRYYHVEKWRVGTIARQLHVHHSVVKRVLADTGVLKATLLPKASIIDPYLPFILETLGKYPNLTASRLYHMVCERGYTGGSNHFRHLIALYRPKRAAEAYLRLRTLPGEQAQVDWGHFGHIIIGSAKRPINAFVIVLSYSRKIFLRFYLNQRMSNFLRGHEAAFTAWGGVPRVCLYDNLKSAVLERQGDAIRFNPTLLEFSAHYRFEPRPVAVARGNEKGRVERAIRYIRDNFFAGREFTDINDLNAQALQWCDGVAADRLCPEDNSQTVRTTFEQEQDKLIFLPDNPFPVDEQEHVKVGKTPYVRFDLNDYSVPHTHVRRTLTVNATLDLVTIFDGVEKISEHQRSYDKGQQIENEAHIEGLVAHKKRARLHRGQDRLTQALPSGATLLKRAAARGYHLTAITKGLLLLLDAYGAAELEVAITEALANNVPHPNAVKISLQKNREQREKLPPIPMKFKDKRAQQQVVRLPNLNDYDELQKNIEETTDEE